MLSLFSRAAGRPNEAEGPQQIGLAELVGVFEALVLPAYVTNRAGLTLAGNKAAQIQFGDIPQGAPLFLKFRLPEARAAFEGVLSSGTSMHFEYHERVPIERWYRVDVSPLLD
ncbi:MAG: hypothetical protein ACRCU5_01585, partial [Rhizobiaceae bacterium]